MRMTTRTTVGRWRCRLALVLIALVAVAQPAAATTYISAEPVPNRSVVGDAGLAAILGIGYPNLERWGRRLLDECQIVDRTIDALAAYGAIRTVNGANTRAVVAAGGFEAITNPSFVLTLQDAGAGAVSAADVGVLSNALGYVLSQGGTAHFAPDNARAYDFALDYAVVTFASGLSGLRAKEFFDFVGTIDAALWSGLFAGFTQIDFADSAANDSMLFLRPAVTKRQFITGLATAADLTADATYVTVNNHGEATTARAGVAFPENDWLAHPDGGQYLARLGAAPSALLEELAALRHQHLQAVADLLRAIDRRTVGVYLQHQFKCPG